MQNKFNKSLFLLAFSTALGGVTLNEAKANDIDVLSILNNSETKSPDITWSDEIVGTENIVNIGGENYQYTIIGAARDKYTGSGGRQTSLSGNVTADFLKSYISESANSTTKGGAIYNNGSTIETITGDFIGNYANNTSYTGRAGGNVLGGAIYNSGTITTLTGNFIGNHGYSKRKTASGAAIYNNSGTITTLTGDFIGNYSEKNGSIGAAILNSGGTINFVADAVNKNYEDDILFKDNYIGSPNQYEAIYNTGASAVITFKSVNNGSYTFYDYINGYDTATIKFVSDDKDSATFNLYNDIKRQGNINFQNKYVMNMLSPEDIHEGTSALSYIQAKNITISAAIQMAVDVDLVNLEMDRFEAENFTIEDTGGINVTTFNIVNNADVELGDAVNIPFVVMTGTSTIADNTSGLNLITNVAGATYEEDYYAVTFDTETGKFVFTKALPPQPEPVGPSEEETTASEADSAANGMAQAVVEAVASQVMNRDITAMIGLNSGDVETLSTWVQTFGSNDDVELKNLSGAIDTQFYGIIGGVDSKKFTYDNGLQAVYGVYGAYTGSRQKYDDNKIKQNGGYFGLSVALRKDALFNNVTLNGGYLKNEANTKFGKDKFDTKVVSLANKTGVDVVKGDLTITPALTLGYMGIDTDDYTAKSGTKVENKFMNVFTVAPELKVAKDFGEGLNGYAKVAYKMFFYDNNKIEADDVLMPSMSVKPYVEYGVGLSKDWSKEEWNPHDLATFAEINRHDGGRTGWDLNLGLKLDF